MRILFKNKTLPVFLPHTVKINRENFSFWGFPFEILMTCFSWKLKCALKFLKHKFILQEDLSFFTIFFINVQDTVRTKSESDLTLISINVLFFFIIFFSEKSKQAWNIKSFEFPTVFLQNQNHNRHIRCESHCSTSKMAFLIMRIRFYCFCTFVWKISRVVTMIYSKQKDNIPFTFSNLTDASRNFIP